MKMVFSDLDGTLLTSDKSIDSRTMAVLQELGERSIEFVPCSGRPYSGIKPELVALDVTHYVVCSNGALICKVESDGAYEVIQHTEMPRESLLWLYDQVKDMDILFDVLADGKSYSERPRFEKMDEFGLDPLFLPEMKAMRTPYDGGVPNLVPTLECIERVSIYWKTREDRQHIIDLVDSRPELTWVTSLPTNLEISHKDATKGAALEWLCNHLGVDVSKTVAFGDGINDISMLELAGDGVAMANSMPEALTAAAHTTLSNDESGVAVYLEKLLA